MIYRNQTTNVWSEGDDICLGFEGGDPDFVTLKMDTIQASWVAALIGKEIRSVESKKARCKVCDWPLADSVAKGCVPGNCSQRSGR